MGDSTTRDHLFGAVVSLYGAYGRVRVFRRGVNPELVDVRKGDYRTMQEAARKCIDIDTADEPVQITAVVDLSGDASWIFYDLISQIDDSGRGTFSRNVANIIDPNGHASNNAEAGLAKAVRDAARYASGASGSTASIRDAYLMPRSQQAIVLERGAVASSRFAARVVEIAPTDHVRGACGMGIETTFSEGSAIDTGMCLYDAAEWIRDDSGAREIARLLAKAAEVHISSGCATIGMAVSADGESYVVMAAQTPFESGCTGVLRAAVDELLWHEGIESGLEGKFVELASDERSFKKMVLKQ